MRGKNFKMYMVMAVLLIATVLAASTGMSAEKPKHWPKAIAIGSGTGATYYAIATGLGKMMDTHRGVPGIPSKTTGVSETVNLIASGDLQMGFITPDVAFESYRGIGAYKDRGPQPLRAFLQDFPLEFEMITFEGSGIKSFADLKGKVVMSRLVGSSTTAAVWETMLDVYGIKESALKASLPWSSLTEGIDALKTGKIHGFYDGGSYPTARWTELAMTHPMRIVDVDDAHMSKIVKKLPWIVPITIPGGTYKRIPEDVQVTGMSIFIACHKDLPDDFVYEVVKMVFTKFDEFGSYHPVCKKFRPESVKRVTGCAYHPGAIKYYKEIGIWTKELDERQAKLLAEIGAKR